MNTEAKRAYREANVRDGLCQEGKEHGPPVHGKLCEACYQKNLAHIRARRARKREAK